MRANAVQNSGTSTGTNSFEGDNSGLAGLTSDLWQTLVELLNNQKMSSNDKMIGEWSNTAWIIDTGESNHMIRNLNIMRDIRDIQQCPVGLPNGQHTAATKEGIVMLNENMKLTNVLYVPSLNCNLISVSRIVDESNCVIQFTKNLCYAGPHFEDADWSG